MPPAGTNLGSEASADADAEADVPAEKCCAKKKRFACCGGCTHTCSCDGRTRTRNKKKRGLPQGVHKFTSSGYTAHITWGAKKRSVGTFVSIDKAAAAFEHMKKERGRFSSAAAAEASSFEAAKKKAIETVGGAITTTCSTRKYIHENLFGDPSESGLPLQCEASLVLPTPSIAAARSNAIQLRDTRRNIMVTTKTVSIAQRERNIFLLTKNNPKRPRQSACVCCGFPPSCCHRTPALRKRDQSTYSTPVFTQLHSGDDF